MILVHYIYNNTWKEEAETDSRTAASEYIQHWGLGIYGNLHRCENLDYAAIELYGALSRSLNVALVLLMQIWTDQNGLGWTMTDPG